MEILITLASILIREGRETFNSKGALDIEEEPTGIHLILGVWLPSISTTLVLQRLLPCLKASVFTSLILLLFEWLSRSIVWVGSMMEVINKPKVNSLKKMKTKRKKLKKRKRMASPHLTTRALSHNP